MASERDMLQWVTCSSWLHLELLSPVHVQVDVLAEFLGIDALHMSFKLLAMTSDQQKSIVADCRQHLLALQTS